MTSTILVQLAIFGSVLCKASRHFRIRKRVDKKKKKHKCIYNTFIATLKIQKSAF